MIDRLIYRSRALYPAPEVALEDILQIAALRNARLHVTGALGVAGSHYVQLLEGPPSALDDLMTSLRVDARHTDLDVLYRTGASTRLTPEWSMARVALTEHSTRVLQLVADGDGLGLTTLLANLVAGGHTRVA